MDSITNYPSDTVDGKTTFRNDLEVIRMADDEWIVVRRLGDKQRWDDEEDTCDDAILCIGCNRYSLTIYEPVKWKEYANAQKWIDKGCIAQLQEGFGILDVGFRKELIVRRY